MVESAQIAEIDLVNRLICLFLASVMVASAGIPVVHAQNERLVLAFYYAWFDQNTWKSGQLADQPAQPYDSRDRAAIQRHVSQAKSAGIDAFVQSWYGPSGGANNMTESNFATLLDVSAQSGFRAAVDFEVTGPFFGSIGDVQGALATLLAVHAKHPAYLKVNGKPVVFFWRQQRFSVDDWAAIRKQVDPNRASIWIAEGTDPSYLRVFEGIYWYSVAWSADPVTSLVNYAAKVRKTAQDLGFRYWVSPVMPGYDDTKLRGAGGFIRPRDNGNYYRETFEGASKSGADWVVVTSFNEWPEGSMIEPSVSYGDTYLSLTRELAAAFRANAVIIPTTVPVESPTMVATPLPVAIQAAQAAPTPTAVQIAPLTSTATMIPSSTATETGTPTLTPTVSPSAAALPTETPLPTQTPMPVQVSDPEIPPAMLVMVGIAALVFGAALGSASARRRAAR
jgi:hypothetical protein